MQGMGILRRLAGVRSGMASAEASCNGVTWCYKGNVLFFLRLGRKCNVTRRVVTLFALVEGNGIAVAVTEILCCYTFL